MSTELPSRIVHGGAQRPQEVGLDAQKVLLGVWRRRRLCLAVGLVVFAEETLKVRAAQAQQAQELFADELSKLSREVAGQEQKINAFKLAHLGELPEQMESNMRGLERATLLMGQKSAELHDSQRRYLE